MQMQRKVIDDRRASKSKALNDGTYDLRFRALLGPQDWAALPDRVQQRFSKRLAANRVALYRGVIREAKYNPAGRILAQLLRLMGGPLPYRDDVDCPAAVCVAEDKHGGGQVWTRVYHHGRGFPQMINSAKRFAGPTGLEEHIGWGIGMALKVKALERGLAFISDHYFWQLGKLRLRLPQWIVPGRTVVQHIDRGDGSFDFTLDIKHGLFGQLLWQRARFWDQ